MGDLSPCWDERLPILGVDAGFAGHRWDMVVKGFFCEVAETFLADGPHKPSGELVRPMFRPRGPLGWASPGGKPGPSRAHPKGTLRTVDTTRSIFASFSGKPTRPTCRDGEPGNRRSRPLDCNIMRAR